MNQHAPFQPDDLEAMQELLDRADAVVAMVDVYDGRQLPGVVGMRHDVDNIIEPALKVAAWEAERGYRSTYYILHTAPYWPKPGLRAWLEEIAGYGHEIGIHTNAIAEALRTGNDPDILLHAALDTLRAWGFNVRGVAAHGDPLCHEAGFVNDEQFVECPRPAWGDPGRVLHHRNHSLRLQPRSLDEFGLEYATERLPRSMYLSDSGGEWSEAWGEVACRFPHPLGQLHILWHPDWWESAFPVAVAV